MTLIRTRGAVVVGLLAAALCVFVQAADAAPRRPKLDSALRGTTATTGLQIIVQTRTGTLDNVTGDARKAGNNVRRLHRLINAASLTVTDAQLKALEKDGSVLTISVDAVLRASTTRITSPAIDGTSRPEVTVPRTVSDPASRGGGSGGGGIPSPGGTDSRGVGVAVIDSGLEPSADV